MPRVALIHDFLLDVRGAERVFAAICDAWPEADVYTAVYDAKGTEGRFADRNPQASFLQKLHPTARTFRPLLPLYPHAIESLDLRGYDIVVSSSSAWAHGVLVDPGAVHVSYCHNPFRYAWSEREATLAARNPLTRPALRVLLSRWRQWDWIAAQRVDAYVANSAITQKRIQRYFGRESTIVHPPVELSRFAPGPVGAHYLVLAELMAHKRIDVAVRAFNALGQPLVIVGDGPEYRRLKRLAGPTVRLTGRLSDDEVADLLRTSQALVVTAEEEFGIAAVESLASGRPVIGLRAGGLLETVEDGVTGAFYDDADDPRSLAQTVAAFDVARVDSSACVRSAHRFGVERFKDRLRSIVEETAAKDRTAPEVDRPVGGLLPLRTSRRGAETMRSR
jgi:glycosyltransferase involved in cell wall biosynthesis